MLTAAPLAAQDTSTPGLAAGETVEVQVHADLDGDGLPDTAYVAAGADRRELRVIRSRRNGTRGGQGRAEVLPLDPYPLADGVLKVKGNVLLLEDLTGGTTAVFSTHRFRWDPRLRAMRLIGLDATLYSRTYAHDGQEASWNLLTGDLITRKLKLTGAGEDRGYDKVGETRRKKPSAPVRLEKAPSGDDLLGWPGAN